MSEKEKAAELVDSFKENVDARVIKQDYLIYSSAEQIRMSKKCALIVVDEIIKALEVVVGHLTIKSNLERQELQLDFEYWKRVKAEINQIK